MDQQIDDKKERQTYTHTYMYTYICMYVNFSVAEWQPTKSYIFKNGQ